MKKYILIILSAILVIAAGLFFYSNQGQEKVAGNEEQSNIEATTEKDIKEVVWEQLPTQEKDRVDGTWENAQVSKITLAEGMMSADGDTSYIGKEVYLVDFPIKSTSALNNIAVYADVDTFDLIGYGFND